MLVEPVVVLDPCRGIGASLWYWSLVMVAEVLLVIEVSL